jgi:hypothetical protein
LKTDPSVQERSAPLSRLHRLCVVDLAAREAWMTGGYARHLAWV